MIEGVSKFDVARRVFAGKARDAHGSFVVIVVEEQSFAITRGREHARIGMQHVAIESVQVHIRSDVRAQRANGVCERGSAKAGMKFFSDGAAADNFASLQN